jgi:hypothetical protein
VRCEQLNVDKPHSPRCFKLCAKSIVEKHEAFHSGRERAQIGAVNSPAASFLVCGTCLSEAFGGGWGKLDPLVPSDASWAAIPTY